MTTERDYLKFTHDGEANFDLPTVRFNPLEIAFNFTERDLIKHRRHKPTKLEETDFHSEQNLPEWILLFLFMTIGGFVIIISTTIFALYLMAMLVLIFIRSHRLKKAFPTYDQELKEVTGEVHKNGATKTIEIDDITFQLNCKNYHALYDGVIYTIYYGAQTHHIYSVEQFEDAKFKKGGLSLESLEDNPLGNIFNFTSQDLQTNSQSQMTWLQQYHQHEKTKKLITLIEEIHNVIFLISAPIIVFFMRASPIIISRLQENILWGIPLFILVLCLLLLGWRLSLSLEKIQCHGYSLNYRVWETIAPLKKGWRNQVKVGKVKFKLTKIQYQALEQGRIYAIYYSRHKNKILSLEEIQGD